MSKYAVGDKVFVKGEIIGTDCGQLYEYRVEFEDGYNDVFSENILLSAIKTTKTYEDGLVNAWELIKEIMSLPYKVRQEIGLDCGDGVSIPNILQNFTPQQVITIVENYKKSQIVIGDVVKYEDDIQGIVIDITSDEDCYVYNENGCIEEHCFKDLKKTGRHIDIQHLLEQIRG